MFTDDTQADGLDTTSDDTTDQSNTVDVDTTEDTTDYKAEAAKWRAIAERHKDKVEKKPDQAVTAPSSDDALLARLEARGIVETDVQSYLISAAKREGKHPVELLSDPYFKDRVTAMRKEKEQIDATPSPSSRVPESKKDVAYWVKQVEAGKPNSPDPVMRAKVRQAIIAT